MIIMADAFKHIKTHVLPNIFRSKHFLIVIGLCCSIISYSSTVKKYSLFNTSHQGKKITIFYDYNVAPIEFAVNDLIITLTAKKHEVSVEPIENFKNKSAQVQIIIVNKNHKTTKGLNPSQNSDIVTLGNQDYAIRALSAGNNKSYWVIGGDRIGAMYGTIHLEEIIKAFGVESIKDESHSPFIKKRGIKFNIPLDDRQPSHDDRGTSAQSNIHNMWDFEFWKSYLDILAKQRYNVLSLWNKHPFPSLIKLKDYPDVALEDVYNKNGKILNISINEKISLWKRIIDYAYDRGIEIYFITWNIHMDGARAKHNISEGYKSNVTKDYLRKSVKELFLTYPKLAGIGVTAGENMTDMNASEKEEWLWETYGKGIQDVKKLKPKRHIRFIHRYWWTNFNNIESRFGQLIDGYDLSYKYAGARVYSNPKPKFAEENLLPYIPKDKSVWWNIRNDDIYTLRWGDPDYVKTFMLNLPKGSTTAGYYLGSDRYVWARESASKNPTNPRQLENKKHWYSFLLWGRLGYYPNTTHDLLKGLIRYEFPELSTDNLFNAWQYSSKIIPLVNRFHWFKWDYLWWPEACISSGSGVAIAGYHDIFDFINAPVYDSGKLYTIKEYSKTMVDQIKPNKTTPFQVADSLSFFAEKTFQNINTITSVNNIELKNTIKDIEAMAFLGQFYANKIKGATNFQLYLDSNNKEFKITAIKDLEKAHYNWKKYIEILDGQYKKMHMGIHRKFDWHKIEDDVKHDIEMVKLK